MWRVLFALVLAGIEYWIQIEEVIIASILQNLVIFLLFYRVQVHLLEEVLAALARLDPDQAELCLKDHIAAFTPNVD